MKVRFKMLVQSNIFIKPDSHIFIREDGKMKIKMTL